MEGGAADAAAGQAGFVRRAIETWAILGGVVLLAVALLTSWSATTGYFFKKPLPGDFELAQMFVAVSVFMFLPYCQLTGANVTADIFTARAGARTVAALTLLSAVIALAFSALLLWRMYDGLLDYRQYEETTAILRIPIWYAYVPALISLVFLALAALITLREAIAGWQRTR